jgi:hypothetical protein
VLRVITDPEPDPAPSEVGDPALEELAGSVGSLAWILGPAAPRTVWRSAEPELRIAVAAGATPELALVVENAQAAASPILLLLSPLRSADGAVWEPGSRPRVELLAAHETRRIVVPLEPQPAPGNYEGSLRLLGADGPALRVVAEVTT